MNSEHPVIICLLAALILTAGCRDNAVEELRETRVPLPAEEPILPPASTPAAPATATPTAEPAPEGLTLAEAYADLLREPVWESQHLAADEVPAGFQPGTYPTVAGTVRGSAVQLKVIFARAEGEAAAPGAIAWYEVNAAVRKADTYPAFLSNYYLRRQLLGGAPEAPTDHQ